MRLKGGKVFIDLSDEHVVDEPSLSLSDEEIKAILEKGLIVKLNNGISFVKDISFNQYQVTDGVITTLQTSIEDVTNETTYMICLGLTNNLLYIAKV